MVEGSKKHLLKTGFDVVCTVACVKFLTVLTVHSILCIANNSLLDLEFWAWIWKKAPSSVPEKRGGQAPRKNSPDLPKEYSDVAMHDGTFTFHKHAILMLCHCHVQALPVFSS
jgi:hypothetical protein